MGRMNGNNQLYDYENSIKKSNELSMAKLSHGLSLNQMQLLAYAIYSTQQDGKTEFHKVDFEEKFGLDKYQTRYIKEDIDFFDTAIVSLIKIDNLKEEFIKRSSIKIFRDIEYNKGLFTFKWDSELLPHIIDLKEKYVLTDLTITSKFKSGFSWILYDFLRGLFNYWSFSISKESLMDLFGVEDRKTYIQSTAQFKRGVLDVAIDEINKHTELKVWYKEKKKGRKIVGFTIHWSTGKLIMSASEKQLNLLEELVQAIILSKEEYKQIKDQKNKSHARELIMEAEGKIIDKSLKSSEADNMINRLKDILRELNNMLEKENGRDTSVYYNWLNGEGES